MSIVGCEIIENMSPVAIEILLTCCTISNWHVSADNLLAVAELVKRKYVTVIDDYETIMVFITDRGIAYAKRQGWIVDAADTSYRPYDRTPLGEEFRKVA